MSRSELHLVGLVVRSYYRAQRRWVLPRLVLGTLTAFALLLLAALPHAFSEAGLRRASQEPVKISQENPDPAGSIHMDWRDEGYRGRNVEIARVSYGRAHMPPPPGTPRPPAAGTMFVSPPLAEALAHDTLLQQRYPYRVVGIIAEDGLAGPRQMIAYLGVPTPSPSDTVRAGGFVGAAATVPALPTPVRTGLPFFAACVLIPLLTLTATTLRLGRSRRARLIAALDLLGVDRRMISTVAAIEAVASSLVAAAAASACWAWGAGRLAVRIPLFDGFFARDLTLSAGLGGCVLGAFVLFNVVVCVTRRRAPRSPAARLADADDNVGGLAAPAGALLGGLVVMLACPAVADQVGIDTAVVTLLAGTLLATAGLSGLGPRVVALLAARWQRSPLVVVRMAAARTLFRPRALTRVATATMAAVLCAPLLLSFFPLLSESTAAASRDAMERFGATTFTARYDGAAVPASVHELSDVVALTETISADGIPTTSMSCEDAARMGAATACGSTLPSALTETLAAIYAISGGPVEVTRQPPRPEKGVRVATSVLVTPKRGTDPEAVRSELLRTSTSRTILSLQEIRGLKENDSLAYQTATALALGALLVMGVVAAVAALAEYVRSGQESHRMLRVLGVPARTTRASYVLQSLSMCAPLVLGALAVGALAAHQFLGLNDASDFHRLLPSLACLALGATLVPCTLIAAITSTLISERRIP